MFRGMNILHTAIVTKHIAEARMLITQYPAMLHAKTTGRFFLEDGQPRDGRYFGETALQFCASSGQPELVTFILDQVEAEGLTGPGTDLQESDRFGNTVLHLSVLWDDLDMYKFLMEESDRRMKRTQLKARFEVYDADNSNCLDAAEVQLLCDTEMGTDHMDVRSWRFIPHLSFCHFLTPFGLTFRRTWHR